MRNLLTIMLCLSFAAAAQAGPIDGLVSYWSFDGDLADTYGGNNGVYVGDTFATGKLGTGIGLDGNTEHIQINNESAYDFGAGGTGMSISLWTRVVAFDST